MAEQEGKVMSQEERNKLVADVKKRGVLNEVERDNLVQKIDADFDAFLQEQLKKSNTKDISHTPATDEDIDNLAEVIQFEYQWVQGVIHIWQWNCFCWVWGLLIR